MLHNFLPSKIAVILLVWQTRCSDYICIPLNLLQIGVVAKCSLRIIPPVVAIWGMISVILFKSYWRRNSDYVCIIKILIFVNNRKKKKMLHLLIPSKNFIFRIKVTAKSWSNMSSFEGATWPTSCWPNLWYLPVILVYHWMAGKMKGFLKYIKLSEK